MMQSFVYGGHVRSSDAATKNVVDEKLCVADTYTCLSKVPEVPRLFCSCQG